MTLTALLWPNDAKTMTDCLAVREKARKTPVLYRQAKACRPKLGGQGWREAKLADVYIQKRAARCPMSGLGEELVTWGHFFVVDWRLLLAIGWKESRFATDPPELAAARHNAWGWGPHMKFKTWDEAIYTIAGGLRRGYLNRGVRRIRDIAPIYAPPSENDTQGWIEDVEYVYKELDGRRYL